jgi:hypothetical protein
MMCHSIFTISRYRVSKYTSLFGNRSFIDFKDITSGGYNASKHSASRMHKT